MSNNSNSHYYLSCKNIDTAIRRAQKMLIEKANNKGLFENFGQEEIGNIRNKFIDVSSYSAETNSNRNKIDYFENWCSNYTVTK